MQALQTENVQDYPRPPALETVPQEIRVEFGGREIVRTTRALRVLETHHAPTYYIPKEDFDAELRPATGRSFCEWKGVAAYWDVAIGNTVSQRAGWSYPNPTKRFIALKDFISLYAHAMDACFVGGERVTPQPGDFYGGWVTSNLEGIVKGGPGTLGW